MSARTKRNILLATVSALALAAVGYQYLPKTQSALPITTEKAGESIDDGVIVARKKVDFQAVIREAVEQRASFLTMTLSRDIVRDQHLETAIKYTPFPASTALVRVKYHVAYPIGYELRPNSFSVAGNKDGLVIELHRPQLIVGPAIKLLSYDILERGILIDEKAAVIELQQKIEPEAERLAVAVLRRSDVVPVSERALRRFLDPLLKLQTDDGTAPPITFEYK